MQIQCCARARIARLKIAGLLMERRMLTLLAERQERAALIIQACMQRWWSAVTERELAAILVMQSHTRGFLVRVVTLLERADAVRLVEWERLRHQHELERQRLISSCSAVLEKMGRYIDH